MMIPLAHPARVALQSAEFLATYGVFGPFEIASPLLQLLMSTGYLAVGLEFDSAETVVRICAYLAGCAAAYILAREIFPERKGLTLVSIAYCSSPSRLYSLYSGAAPNELLFWSLISVCGLAIYRSWKSSTWLHSVALTTAALVLVSARVWTLSVWDAVSLLELCVLAGVVFLWPKRVRGLIAFPLMGTLVLLFSIGVSVTTLSPSGTAPSRAAGVENLETRLNAVLATVSGEVFQRPSKERIGDAILWARAMGTRAVWRREQFRAGTFFEYFGDVGIRAALDLGGPIPGDAVLVSRHQWERLAPIRGLYDREALERYIAWATRPESLSVDAADGVLSVQADLSSTDVVLIRTPFDIGWVLRSANGELTRDPIGYTVFVPAADTLGVTAIELTPTGFRVALPAPAELHTETFPAIKPDGLIHGTGQTPPPFSAGDVISIFGSEFLVADTKVWVGDQPAEVLWSGRSQINAQLPSPLAAGKHELAVESAGLRSFPRSFEVSAP